MTRQIVALTNLDRRPPEAGRIRLGVKTATAMKSIDTFRFTSPRRDLIEAVAVQYGGTVAPWNEPKARMKKQFEVITTSNKIEVLLPPNGLSTYYELWSGGGVTRRCNGTTVETPQMTGDDYEMVESPCICLRKQIAECAPYTRLNVILPGIDFHGTWRLETKGWNAAIELPGMFDMIAGLTARAAMVKAHLHLEPRSSVHAGKTKNFVVPTLSVASTPDELLAGGGRAVAQLEASPSTSQRELAQPSSGVPFPSTHDVIVDAEVVDEAEELRLEEMVRNHCDREGIDANEMVCGLWDDTAGDLRKINAAVTKWLEGKIHPTLVGGVLTWEVV